MTDTGVPRRRWRLLSIPMVAAVLAACSGAPSGGGSGDTADGTPALSVLAFTSSAPGWNATVSAFDDGEVGSSTAVQTTYGPSGELAQSVLDGGPADIVYLADGPNMARLVREQKVAPDWDSGPYRGQPFGSVSTLVVREGNPLNIRTWSDLLRPGVSVIAANPVLSGSGKWGLMAGYASISNGGRDEQAGIDYLNKLILEHVLAGPATVAEAMDVFLAGTGDVLITAENSAIDAERQSGGIERILPPQTLQIDNQAAVVSASERSDEAQGLLDFLYTPETQRLWAEAGFRPAVPEVAQEFAAEFPVPQTLWTIDDIGGWAVVDPKFYDPENGIVTKIFDQATT